MPINKHAHVVIRIIAGKNYYLTDFGIANGECARFSCQTSDDINLAIPMTPVQAEAVTILQRSHYPLEIWYYSTVEFETSVGAAA